MTSEELLGRILHRDASVLILDKPAGLPVHRGPKGGETLGDHLDGLRFGLKWRPELAHRLDRDTSGCLALGRHPRALARLSQIFREGSVEKTYLAIVQGTPAVDSGTIDIPLARRSPEQGWWMRADPMGQPARTDWRALARAEGFALLELRPITGRTHQLRVHCAESGMPILGDAIYGGAPRFEGPGLMLHAWRIALPYHPRKPAIRAVAPLPSRLQAELDVRFGQLILI